MLGSPVVDRDAAETTLTLLMLIVIGHAVLQLNSSVMCGH